MSMKTAGDHFREIRERLGLPLDEVAYRVKSTKSYLTSVENNKRRPSLRIYSELLKVYGNRISPQRKLALRKLMLDNAGIVTVDFSKAKSKILLFQAIRNCLR